MPSICLLMVACVSCAYAQLTLRDGGRTELCEAFMKVCDLWLVVCLDSRLRGNDIRRDGDEIRRC